MSDEFSNCAVCKKLALMMCQRCSEGYCSSDCQYADWNRHKYYCIPMPPLVPLSRNEKPKVQQRLNSVRANLGASIEVCKSTAYVSEVAVSVPKLSNDWKSCFELPVNEFFDCIVLHIAEDSNNVIWVIDKRNESNLKKFMDYVRQCCESNILESAERISVGELFIAVNGTQVQRVEVIESNMQLQDALVRLIDCGKTIKVKWNTLYIPKPKMAETKAFAVCVKIQREHVDITIGIVILCRLIGTKNREGILLAQVKPKDETDEELVKLLQSKQSIQLIKSSSNAHLSLVKLSNSDEIIGKLSDLLKDTKVVCELKLNACNPVMLSARCGNVWHRALLIDQVEIYNVFLVYEVDEGKFSLCNEVRGMSTHLRSIPHCVFAITMNAKPEEINEEKFEKPGYLSIQLLSNGETNHLNGNKHRCMLYGNNEPLCEVTAFACIRQINMVGPLAFKETIVGGDKVHITHVINYAEVYVNTVDLKHYGQLYAAIVAKCPFYKDEKLMVGDIVLVEGPERHFYRAEVILLAGDKKTVYNVFDIDTGKSHSVSYNCLRKANDFVKYLPTSLLRVKLSKLCNVPHISVPENSQALFVLERKIAVGAEFKINFQNLDTSEVNLLCDNEMGLFVELLSTLFMSHTEEFDELNTTLDSDVDLDTVTSKLNKISLESTCGVERNVLKSLADDTNIKSLPPSPPDSPSNSVNGNKADIGIEMQIEKTVKPFQRFTKAEVKVIKIPTGDKIELILFDRGQYDTKGLVTGCYFANKKEFEAFDNHRKSEDQYGICPHWDKPANYMPNEQELCLAQFDLDKKWYRAVCLRHDGDTAEIQYLDYGNLQKVSQKKLIPLPKDMLYPSHANTCFIKDYTDEKIKALVSKGMSQRPSVWKVDYLGNEIYQLQIPVAYLK